MKLKFLHPIPEDIKDKFQKQVRKKQLEDHDDSQHFNTVYAGAEYVPCSVSFLKKTGHAEQPDIL